MKNIFIISLLILSSFFSNAQNPDKLTLKGGVMLGVPDRNEVFVNTIRRGQCFGNCLPMYEGELYFKTTLSAFGGLEFSPYEIKINTNNSLLPFIGLDVSMINSKYEYFLSSSDHRGNYNISSFTLGLPLGVKFKLFSNKLQFLSFMGLNFYSKLNDIVLNEKHENDERIYNRNDFGNKNINAFLTLGLQARYNINEKIGFLVGYNAPLFVNYDAFSLKLDHIGNVYPYLYHQISLGVTYQLLSYKNKTTVKE